MESGLPGEAWRKMKVCLPVALEKAMCATMRCTSSGCVGLVAVFLKDWELAQEALSCHVALDMLCQEVHEAWSGGATERPAVGKSAFLSPWTGCDS